MTQVAFLVLALIGELDLELAPAVEGPGDRPRIERLARPPAEEPVVRVDRQSGAGVVHPGLRDVEVQRLKPLLNELHEVAEGSEVHVGIEYGVATARRETL